MNDILELFKIAGKIDLDGVDKANKDLDGLEGKGRSTASKLGGFAKKAAKGVAVMGAAAVAATTAAFAMTNKVTQNFDRIAKTAPKLGITTDAFQEMEYWAGQNGISAQSMERAVGRLNQRIGLAADGNDKYAEALSNLGVDMDEVRKGTVTTDEAMATSIKTLSEMTNESEKSALASELFGTKMARDLMPALKDGALTLEDAKKKAADLGIVIGEDTLASAEVFQDTWDDLTRSFGVFGQQIIAKLMPAFQTMMDWVLSNMPQIQAVFQTVFDVIGDIFNTARNWFQTLISILGDWYSSNQETLTGIRDTVVEAFSQVVEFLQNAWATIQEFWQENGQNMLDYVTTIFTGIRDTSETLFNAVKEIIEQVIGYIVPWVQEKLQALSDFWAENGAQIIEAVQNAFSFIQSIIEFVMPAIQFMVKMVWGIIQGIFNGALNIIMGLIKTFAGLFTGDWSKMWEGVKQLLGGALEFIWNLISLTLIGRGIALIKNFATLGANLFRGLGGNIRTIFSNIMSWVTNIVSRLVNSVLNFFRNMGSGISSTVRGIFNGIKNTFNNILSFVKGLGTSFLNAGKGLIDQMAKGITNAAGKVIDSVKNIAGKVRNFLPFSPAKEGPLSDLDKLDFEGPIGDSITGAENSLKKKMNNVLGTVRATTDVNLNGGRKDGRNTPSGRVGELEMVITLLRQLIDAVKEGKEIHIDGKKVTGTVNEINAIDDVGRYF